MLSFQAQSVSMFIDHSALAGNGAVEEIARVELQTWFCGMHFHDTTAGWFIYFGHHYNY